MIVTGSVIRIWAFVLRMRDRSLLPVIAIEWNAHNMYSRALVMLLSFMDVESRKQYRDIDLDINVMRKGTCSWHISPTITCTREI